MTSFPAYSTPPGSAVINHLVDGTARTYIIGMVARIAPDRYRRKLGIIAVAVGEIRA